VAVHAVKHDVFVREAGRGEVVRGGHVWGFFVGKEEGLVPSDAAHPVFFCTECGISFEVHLYRGADFCRIGTNC